MGLELGLGLGSWLGSNPDPNPNPNLNPKQVHGMTIELWEASVPKEGAPWAGFEKFAERVAFPS